MGVTAQPKTLTAEPNISQYNKLTNRKNQKLPAQNQLNDGKIK